MADYFGGTAREGEELSGFLNAGSSERMCTMCAEIAGGCFPGAMGIMTKGRATTCPVNVKEDSIQFGSIK
jgi:hypothetical protein